MQRSYSIENFSAGGSERALPLRADTPLQKNPTIQSVRKQGYSDNINNLIYEVVPSEART